MEVRPLYVKCVRRTHVNHKDLSWCGRRVVDEWAFIDAAHAAENGLQGGRLVVCPECRKAIIEALNNGATSDD